MLFSRFVLVCDARARVCVLGVVLNTSDVKKGDKFRLQSKYA